jgi:ATP-dependent Clp endopeptidase proteolytic subunit ClpP|tara:strand:+ start:3284 stop:4279 length:996 start_codon:yes stop_codon:yes gene_type:complete
MNWYNIKNIAESNTTEVMIYDEIGMWGVDAKSFIEEIKSIPNNNSILLRINSPGGSVIDGLAIFDALNRLPQKVTSRIEGLAASMASVIALAADEVVMSENSLFMIHNVWGMEVGGSEELRKAADFMDKLSAKLLSIYVSKTGKTEEEIQGWMDAETWFDSSEAMTAGFINSIEAPIKLAAKFDLDKLNYKNKSLVKNLFNNQKENKVEKQFEDLKGFISELFKNKAEIKEVKILDNEEVINKMSALEESIEDSAKSIVELNGSIVEKDGYIATLTNELEVLKGKAAKKEGMPTDVTPEKDPNPTPGNKSVDAWGGLADMFATSNNLYLKN